MSSFALRGFAVLSSALSVLMPMAISQAQSSAKEGTDSSAAVSNLEEIVVTAQRRQENLQRVPITVAALTERELQGEKVVSTEDLQFAVPGLDFTRRTSGSTVFIRGVGSTSGEVGNESPVAVYLDGVYIPSALGNLFSFNSVERVEVLKGPQGTLFGRNATGGVVQVITKNPSDTPAADVSVGYGNYGTIDTSFYGTTKVVERLSTNLAIQYSDQADGWGHNFTLNSPTFTANDLGIRNKWLWTPTDKTSVNLSLDFSRTYDQKSLNWQILPGSLALTGLPNYSGFYNSTNNFADFARTTQKAAAIHVDQDFDAVRFVSITSYRTTKTEFTLDQDTTAVPIINATLFPEEQTFTQEVHVLSPEQNKLQWIAGGYYFNDTSQYDPVNIAGLAAAPFEFEDIYARNKTHSYAGFGQASEDIIDNTKLTLGLRYTTDLRHISGNTVLSGVGPVAPASQEASFSKWTYRTSLDHQFTPEEMVYVSYNRGFKSGLFNLLSYGAPAVKPEVLDATEIGLKSELLDHRVRLNVAAYYYDYKDIQVAQIKNGATVLVNAATAYIHGVDANLEAAPFNNFRFQVAVSYADGKYESFDAAPLNFPSPTGGNTPSVGSVSGGATVHTPKLTGATSANYVIPSAIGKFDSTVSLAYNDGFYWDPDHRLRQPVYFLLNTSFGWMDPTQHWEVRAWGKNLGNKEYYSYESAQQPGDVIAPAPPRTYGLTFLAHFF